MIRNRTIAKLGIAFLACAGLGAWALAATPPPGVVAPESALNSGGLDSTVDRPAVPVARERGPSGNPLWGIPLRVLTATRERPLFSPSRRPPAPPAVAAPVVPRPVAMPKPAEPERPLLTIVGTIVGGNDAIGVFVEQASNNVIRIHAGQDHDGWVLRSVHGREAMFEKDTRKATLALPAPGEMPGPTAVAGQPVPAAPAQAALPLPAPAAGVPQAGNTWVDGDGNMITPPPAKLLPAAGRGN
jgi:general secretion pathway protein N